VNEQAETLLAQTGWPTDDPRLLSLLPMVYMAWASGDLDAGEAGIIRERMERLDWSAKAKRGVAERWLDPQSPPGASELRSLLSVVRLLSPELPKITRLTLADLGIEMAQSAGAANWATPEVCEALAAVEEALGVDASEACHELLVPEGKRPEVDEEEPAAAFDVGVMTRLLGGAYRDVRIEVLNLLRQPGFRYVYGSDRATYRERVFGWMQELARHGLGATSYAEEYGGTGDVGRFIAVFETLGFHDLSMAVKFGVQFGLFGGSINLLGSDRHRDKYLRQVGTLELPGCYAMTEAGHGSNVRDIGTVARFDAGSDEFVIHTPNGRARKVYIGNAALHGRMATVFAQLEIGDVGFGVHAFLVPIRDESGEVCEGVRIQDSGEKQGLNGIDNGTIWFDQVRIPRDNLLDRFATVDKDGNYTSPIVSDSKRFFAMLSTLVGGRISVAAVALSAAKSGLAIAIRYGARRRQFGPPGAPETLLLDYRTHQRRLMPPLATAYALDFAIKHLVRSFLAHRENRSREVETLAAALKAYATWNTVRTLQVCREACGGAGYMAVNRLASLKADTDVFTTFEGDNTVLMQLVAKALLGEFREQFEETGFVGTLKHVAGQATRAVTELNPIVTRIADQSHLRDPEFQLGAMRYREEELLVNVARRLKGRIDRGMSLFDAFNECQDHLVTLAHAHVERVILELFLETIEDCPDPVAAETLTMLRNLFALSRIEADRGWFLESGYIEKNKAKAIRKQVNLLCADARRQAVPLVDSFGIPDELLGAPIAMRR
jgi:acyl-CoA oxidase